MATAHETDAGNRQARVAVSSGESYRIDSPPENGIVVPDLAAELERVLQRFATEAGFTATAPVGVFFKPGIFGHHLVGRAADLYAVGGIGLDVWKARWDAALAHAHRADRATGESIVAGERRRNLGWRLYKALQCHGRWSQPYGHPIQLFGPWTRSEGPWKYISDRLLRAHRDHIHVAR